MSEGYDAVKRERYYRLLGGTIEFGELGADAVVREFREELGVEMTVRHYLGTLENLFTFEGEPGHELVRIDELEPLDRSFLDLDEPPVIKIWRATSSGRVGGSAALRHSTLRTLRELLGEPGSERSRAP